MGELKWLKQTHNNIELSIFVKPNAKKTALVKGTDTFLHIALHAKPIEGEANKELIRFLSEHLEIPKSIISLSSGEHSRYKKVTMKRGIKNINEEKIILKLMPR